MLIKIHKHQLERALDKAERLPISLRCLYPNWRHSFVRAEFYKADKGEIGVTVNEGVRWYR